MAPLEAQTLLLRHLGLNFTEIPDIIDLSFEVCKTMHWTALAVHLAGARLRMETKGWLRPSLLQIGHLLDNFLRDMRSHRGEIFKAETVRGISTYKSTIYTVLDSNLRAIDQSFLNTPSRQVLALIAHIEASDTIPREMFELVAKGINDEANDAAKELPGWVRDLFPINQDNQLDDFRLRESLRPL